MKTKIEHGKFDTCLTFSDWRFSATVVGMVRFLRVNKELDYELGDDYLAYNQIDFLGEKAEERYLLFAEQYFSEAMHHVLIESLLEQDELSEAQEKLVNEKLKGNAVLKRVLSGLKYSQEDKKLILKKIADHRLEIIRETYRTGKSLYANFANPNSLLEGSGEIGRLVGYNIDMGKKKKSVAYYRDFKTFLYQDEPEFDFIPFAFTKSRESFFINNNFSAKALLRANDGLAEANEDRDNPRRSLFMSAGHSANFVAYDVEIITKVREHDYFETLYVREEAIRIFKAIGDSYPFMIYPCRLANGDYLNLETVVTNSVLNGVHLDDIIETLLKNKAAHSSRIRGLIMVNQLIYGGDKMDRKMKDAKDAASAVKERLESNKVNSYKQKLISALMFKDYDRFCEVLLQLSSYAKVVFSFAYDLFEDFEGNKNIAYAFVNALNSDEKIQGGKKDE